MTLGLLLWIILIVLLVGDSFYFTFMFCWMAFWTPVVLYINHRYKKKKKAKQRQIKH